MRILLKGQFSRTSNTYKYYDTSLIAERTGSIIDVINDSHVDVTADIVGIDKIYYKISGEDIVFSNNFSDFFSCPLDARLWPMQLSCGFVPYPFTVLQGVRRALPGVKMKFFKQENDEWSCEYDTKGLQEFFDAKEIDDTGIFKKDFINRIGAIKSACDDATMICALSGGFDSLLLSHLFQDRLKMIFHYADDINESRGIRNSLESCFPTVPWHVCDGNDVIGEDLIKSYFENLDEPNCDAAGQTIFIMNSKLLPSVQSNQNLVIIDGQAADALFSNGRKYFKEWLMGIFLCNSRVGLDFKTRINADTALHKILDYLKSTRTRFFDIYTEHFDLGDELGREIFEVYEIYNRALKTDRTNFFGIIHLLLYYSGPRIAKYKAITKAFKVKYLLPFYDYQIVKMAFSVKANRKVGYKLGKKLLRESFPEIKSARYLSRPFMNDSMLKGLFREKFDPIKSRAEYPRYFSEQWAQHRFNCRFEG